MEQRISESGANGSTGYRGSEKEERTSSKRLCLRISLSNGSLLFLRFSSPFRRACSSFSDSFVPTVRRFFWILHNSNSIVSFRSVRSSFSDALVLLQLFVACSQSLQPIGKRMQKQLCHQLLTRDARKAGTKPGRGFPVQAVERQRRAPRVRSQERKAREVTPTDHGQGRGGVGLCARHAGEAGWKKIQNHNQGESQHRQIQTALRQEQFLCPAPTPASVFAFLLIWLAGA